MKRPNFFIIGAPKCGTTSLAMWLSEHPAVYFSPHKEPTYFAFDQAYRPYRTLDAYEHLFVQAQTPHQAIGEGSTSYLYSHYAVPAILAYSAAARFIVMIRNPIEMAVSLYWQRRFNRDEDLGSFSDAWEAQSRRIYGADIPRLCREPQLLLYGPRCRVGEQIERLYKHVPPERVLILTLDEVRDNTRGEYLRVLEFLRLEDDGRTEFPVYNTAKAQRSAVLGNSIKYFGSISTNIKRRLGVRGTTGLLTGIKSKNIVQNSYPALDEAMRVKLRTYFASDVEKLSAILNRDFSAWLE